MKELEDKITELKRKASNKSLPPSAVSALNKMIEKAESELSELKQKNAEPVKKEKPVKDNPSKEKKAKAVKEEAETVTVDGKKYSLEECESLYAAFEARKQQHNQANGEYRTKPVTDKVATNVATAVKQAVAKIPKGKSAKTVVKELNAVKNAVDELFSSLEKLLGKKISDSKIKNALDIIKQAIKEAKEE